MLADQLHRLAPIGRLKNDRFGFEFLEHASQRLTDQDVIVDQEDLHSQGCPAARPASTPEMHVAGAHDRESARQERSYEYRPTDST